MEPQDESDFDKWYREEHIPLLKLAPGYRRSTRYQLLSQERFPGQVKPLKYLALHEVENVDHFMQSEETQKANSTAWTKRQVSSNKMVLARAWKRLA
jgi:predicted DNA-binding transcriptional regulator AlpA